MKLDFRGLEVLPEPVMGPPLKKIVFEGEELKEIHERMRKWLREHNESCISNPRQ